jgi:hypothetical protein
MKKMRLQDYLNEWGEDLLTLTPAQLRLKGSEGWDTDAIEDLIDAKQESRKNLKGETVHNDPAFITVYETHHKFANAYLKAKPAKKDERTYSQQMHVIAWHVNDKNEREDFTLYKGKEKKDPYSISHWKKTKGRTLGVGVVEDMFQPQISQLRGQEDKGPARPCVCHAYANKRWQYGRSQRTD